jgi:hypothetical protein
VNGDFNIVSNNCTNVPAGSSCNIAVAFTPTALGSRSGLLTVQSSGGSSQTASLSGTGTPGFTLSGNSLAYGDQDVGYAAPKTLTLTSIATSSLPVPPFATTGAYSVDTSACGSSVAAGASCAVKITFRPTITGAQQGALSVNSTSLLYSGLSATMTGNGVDFTIALNPTSGKVIAGDSVSTTASIAPIAGFSFPLTVNCNLGGAVAAGCNLSASGSIVPQSPSTNITVNFTTTSEYAVIGYGAGEHGWPWLIVVASGFLLLISRRRAGALVRVGLFAAVLICFGTSLIGCSGKLPAQNSSYTGPGNYAITVTATDGFLVHSATYNLTVSAK